MIRQPYICAAASGTPNWWPLKLQAGSLNYSLNISPVLTPGVDFISSVSVACSPSGSGEMVISNPIVTNTVLTLTTTGGVPGRVYTIEWTVICSDGLVYAFIVYQGVPPIPGYLIPVAPVPTFGTPVVPDLGMLFNNGGVLNTTYSGFASSTLGLPPGAVWSNGGEVDIVPGSIPDPTAAPIYFDQITTVGLIGLGAANFPLTSPPIGSEQLWSNNGVCCIA